jgi:hypothetical protein
VVGGLGVATLGAAVATGLVLPSKQQVVAQHCGGRGRLHERRNVYFAQGAQVLRVTSPYGHPPNVIVTGLVSPRGVAFDGTHVYVAEKGTSNPASPDGRILMVPP